MCELIVVMKFNANMSFLAFLWSIYVFLWAKLTIPDYHNFKVSRFLFCIFGSPKVFLALQNFIHYSVGTFWGKLDYLF